MNITDIINYLNETNSTNDKLKKLAQFKDNDQLRRILEMTYDKARFTYHTTFNNVSLSRKMKTGNEANLNSLDFILDNLEILTSRQLTGNNALEFLGSLHDNSSPDNAIILEKIIDRDLKIGMGRTQINKVFKDLIIKPAYMRCGIFNKKTQNNIQFPAPVQLKADGTYREALVENGKVEFMSRSGESNEYPTLKADILNGNYPDGYYFGEITVNGITNRSEGNGIINSDHCPHDKLNYSVWDFVTIEEYKKAKDKVNKKDKPVTIYKTRFERLQDIVNATDSEHIQVIETFIVNNAIEAMQHCVNWMKNGLEGAVLKNWNAVFKDGTSNEQLKMKLKIDADVRCKGFKLGKKGTKNDGLISSIVFENDEGTIKGSCFGISDKELKTIRQNPDSYIDRVFSLTFNDITKGRNNDYYALSHPRFGEWRNDKDTTDTLERVMEMKQMAMLLENIE